MTDPAPGPASKSASKPAPAPASASESAPEPAPAGQAGEPERRILAEIYITPLGTGGPSIRAYIRALRPLLEASGLRWEQTALGTLVEGPLVRILELTRALHETTFLAGPGAERVVTHLRIDERRDGDRRL